MVWGVWCGVVSCGGAANNETHQLWELWVKGLRSAVVPTVDGSTPTPRSGTSHGGVAKSLRRLHVASRLSTTRALLLAASGVCELLVLGPHECQASSLRHTTPAAFDLNATRSVVWCNTPQHILCTLAVQRARTSGA